jgi:Protein of unknown function (DUF3224)
MRAIGTFDVKLVPQTSGDPSADASISRMSIEKQFHGALEGASKGEMLASIGGIQGSAGYVAMEQVTGSLDGRAGIFVLEHTGTMTRGVPTLSVNVVPDSGTEQLRGLSGSMKIDVIDGTHHYELTYKLDETN